MSDAAFHFQEATSALSSAHQRGEKHLYSMSFCQRTKDEIKRQLEVGQTEKRVVSGGLGLRL